MNSLTKELIKAYEFSVVRIILLCISEVPFSLGMQKVIGILKGSKSSFFIERKLHKLSTYGILPTFSKEYLETVIGVLIEQGFLEIEMVSYYENLPTLKITEKGKVFLQKPFDNVEISFVEKLADKEVIELNSTEQLLFEKLRRIRLRIAIAKGLPPFTICHDSILREMAKNKPTTFETLLFIHGVGKKFIENYGEFFIDEIKKNFS